MIIVEEPFDWLSVSETKAQQALEELAQYREQIKKHAASVLSRVADAAKQAGVSCNKIQIENAQPYKAIIATAENKGCDIHRHGIAWAQRTIRTCARQCDKQGADAHEHPGIGLSLNARAILHGSLRLFYWVNDLLIPVPSDILGGPGYPRPLRRVTYGCSSPAALTTPIAGISTDGASPVLLLELGQAQLILPRLWQQLLGGGFGAAIRSLAG